MEMEKDNKDAQDVLKALSQFCSNDRLALKEPFRDGEYMVATNGVIAVRYLIPNGIDGFPDESPDHPKTDKIFKNGEHDELLHLQRRHIVALQSLYADWCKHVSEGVKCNPDDLDEFICPCCDQRLYLVRNCGELEDADEYDENYANRQGFVIVMPNDIKVFLKGSVLSNIISCYGSYVLGGLLDSKFTISIADRRLKAEGLCCEMVCALNEYDSDYHHSLGVLKLD
jgi:hypothetical protein